MGAQLFKPQSDDTQYIRHVGSTTMLRSSSALPMRVEPQVSKTSPMYNKAINTARYKACNACIRKSEEHFGTTDVVDVVTIDPNHTDAVTTVARSGLRVPATFWSWGFDTSKWPQGMCSICGIWNDTNV